MKVETDWDRLSFETEAQDADLLRAVRDTAESVRDLAGFVRGERETDCFNCGHERPCRPLAVVNEAGEPIKADVCAGCQAEFVEAKLADARERADEVREGAVEVEDDDE